MPKRNAIIDAKSIIIGYFYGLIIYFVILVALLYIIGYGSTALSVLTEGNSSSLFYSTIIAGFIAFVITEEGWFKQRKKRR